MKAIKNDVDIILRTAAYFSRTEDGAIDIGKELTYAGADNLADGGFWILDLSGNGEEYYSPNYLKSMGYDYESFPPKPKAWKKVIIKEDLERLKASFKVHIEAEDTETFHQIATYNKKEGGVVTFICTGLLVIKKGVVQYMVGSHELIK